MLFRAALLPIFLGALLFTPSVTKAASQGTVRSAPRLDQAAGLSKQFPGPLVVVGQLTLSTHSVAPGQKLRATVTLKNRSGARLQLDRIVIAVRPPGGTHNKGPYFADFKSKLNVTLDPNKTITLKKARTYVDTDPPGAWYAYVTYETAAAKWFDATPDVHFTVQAKQL